MGNQLEKQYGLKEKPLKISGSYNFLKFADHPSDPHTSLIIVKHPHRAGVVASDIILPIKEIKPIGHSDYSLALCKHCKPLALVKPRSEVEMKLMIKQIVKLSSELGRIFYCSGRLMLWCEQIRSTWDRSPQEIQTGKKSDSSSVFCSGLCLVNYLHFAYQTPSKSKTQKNKLELENFFNPKDKKQYFDFVNNLLQKLTKTSFWSKISQGMQNLITVMLAKDPSNRINLQTLIKLPYFSGQKQLKLYHMVADDLGNYQEKQSIMLMETLEIVIKDGNVFDSLMLQEYLGPVLVSQLERKPQKIISCVLELPSPPVSAIQQILKKVPVKNVRFFNSILYKVEKIYSMLDQQAYDSGISRAAFCSFEWEQLHDKLIRTIPFLLRTIKNANYKKEIQTQLVAKILENPAVKPGTLLLGLKCMISILEEDLLSSVAKICNIKYDPTKYELEINIHILELYKNMLDKIEGQDLLSIMIPKIQPFLVHEQISDEIFFKAKKLVDLIMQKLIKMRDLGPEDEVEVAYDKEFFMLIPPLKAPQMEVIGVLRKQMAKNKNEDIVWLGQILQKYQYLLGDEK